MPDRRNKDGWTLFRQFYRSILFPICGSDRRPSILDDFAFVLLFYLASICDMFCWKWEFTFWGMVWGGWFGGVGGTGQGLLA